MEISMENGSTSRKKVHIIFLDLFTEFLTK